MGLLLFRQLELILKAVECVDIIRVYGAFLVDTTDGKLLGADKLAHSTMLDRLYCT